MKKVRAGFCALRMGLQRSLAATALFAMCAWGAPALAQQPTQPAGTERQQASPIRSLANSGVATHNGAFQTSVKVDIPKFRNLTPEVSLAYNSSGANAFAGVGWRLEGFSQIERAAPFRGTPRFAKPWNQDSYLLDGEELVPSTALGGTHATRRQSFQRIRSDGTTWTVTERDGTATTYSPVFQTGAGILRWGATARRDTRGNEVTYTWWCDTSGGLTRECYPSSISYANTSIQFSRELRPDVETFASGNRVGSMAYRLKSIDVAVGGISNKSYVLGYAVSVRTGRSILKSVQPYGRAGALGLPATTTSYIDSSSGFGTGVNVSNKYGMTQDEWYYTSVFTDDFNGDGKSDLLLKWKSGANAKAFIVHAIGNGEFSTRSEITSLYGLSAATWFNSTPITADFNSDGRSDLLLIQKSNLVGTALLLLANSSGGFANAVNVTTTSGLTPQQWYNSEVAAADFNGDGSADLLLRETANLIVKANILISNGSGGFLAATNIADSYGLTGAIWYRSAVASIADFNGDGRSDIILNYASAPSYRAWALIADPAGGFAPAIELTTKFGLNATVWKCANIFGGDFNGDGAADLILQRGGTCPTGGNYLLTASGADASPSLLNPIFDLATEVSSLYGMSDAKWQYADLLIGDFNGDAKSDVLIKSWVGAQIDPHVILYGKGTGFNPAVDVSNQFGMTPQSWGYSNPRIADYDGDGDDDILTQGLLSGNSPPSMLLIANGASAELLLAISNGFGGTTTASYKPSSQWLNSNRPPITQTVTSLVIADGRGASIVTGYEYAGGAWDPVERRQLGFRYVSEMDVTGAQKATYFYQGASFSEGEVEEEQRLNSSGQIMSKRVRVLSTAPGVPYVRQLLYEDMFECNGDASCKNSRIAYSYNIYGALLVQTDLGEVGPSDDDRTISSVYNVNTVDYIVGLPSVVTTRAGASGAGARLAEARFYYDQSTLLTQPPSRGDVTRLEKWLNTTDEYLGTNFTFDLVGNQLTETDPLGHTTTTIWNTPWNLFASDELNHLQQGTHYTWDPVCGLKLSVTDANQNSIASTYDQFCRPFTELRPDGGSTTFAYLDFGNTLQQRVVTTTNDGLGHAQTVSAYFDGLARTWKTATNTGELSETRFDARGLIAASTAPYGPGESGASLETKFEYDALRRRTLSTLPDLSTRTELYGDWSTTSCDETGKPTSRFRDGYGRTRRVVEYLGKACVLDPQGTMGTDSFDTIIKYDLMGWQVGYVKAVGHEVTYRYDSLGRQIAAEDPDMGNWSFFYDNGSRLIQQVDGKLQVLNYDFDVINRPIAKRNAASVALATFSYDAASQTNGLGRRTGMSDANGSTAFGYDAMGRQTRQARTTNAPYVVTYTIARQFDGLDRLRSLTYPDGESVAYDYDASGRPMSLTSSLYATPLVQQATYDARGRVRTRLYGNGTSEIFDYDPKRLWLTGAAASNGGGVISQISFARNVRGEVTSRANIQDPADRWTYVYDDMRRLKSAANLTNPVWSETFEYDGAGRMTFSSRYGAYQYASTGVPPAAGAPNSIAGVAQTYDGNGNLTQGGSPGSPVAISYSVDNKPILVNGNSRSYDADGELVSSGTLITLGDLFERTAPAFSKPTTTNFYTFDGKKVGNRRVALNSAVTTVSFYHLDHLGSPATITDLSGAISVRQPLAPYGLPLASYGTPSIGLAGQRFDATGLYQMGARQMSPNLGLFISPDPARAGDPERPQSLNKYSYGQNSPTNLIDPSGLSAEEPTPSCDGSSCPPTVTKSIYAGSMQENKNGVKFTAENAESRWQEANAYVENTRAAAEAHRTPTRGEAAFFFSYLYQDISNETGVEIAAAIGGNTFEKFWLERIFAGTTRSGDGYFWGIIADREIGDSAIHTHWSSQRTASGTAHSDNDIDWARSDRRRVPTYVSLPGNRVFIFRSPQLRETELSRHEN